MSARHHAFVRPHRTREQVLTARPSGASVAVGVDVGGTKIATAAVAADGSLVGDQLRRATPEDPDAVVDAVEQVVRQVLPDGVDVPVGVGYPGMVTQDGRIAAGPSVALRDFPLAEELARRLGTDVVVENDGAAAAWAEYLFGAGSASSANMAMVTLGTGVGGGLVLGGRLFRGSHGFAAEVGHMVTDIGGRVGPSGIPGEVEAHCSGTALRSLAVDALSKGRVASSLHDVPTLTGTAITAAADDGDQLALSLLGDLGHHLGVALASIVNLLDIEVVVVGGGLGEAHRHFLTSTRTALRRHLLAPEIRPEVPVVPAALGNRAGIVGAALLATRRQNPAC